MPELEESNNSGQGYYPSNNSLTKTFGFGRAIGSKPKIFGDIVDWTQDVNAGDIYYTGEGSGQGWYPIWKTSLKGIETTVSKTQSELSDPNSKYYTDYYKKLKGVLSAQSSLNSLLGLNRAMGLSMTGSATIANEQRKAVEGRITDYAGQSTKDLFQGNIGQANSLLGLQSQLWGQRFQQEQFDAAQKFDWSSFGKMAGQIAGYALAPATGGASLIPTAIGSFGSLSSGQQHTGTAPQWIPGVGYR